MMMRLVALALAAAFTTANSGHNSSQPFNAVLLDTPLPMALSDLTATRVGEVVYIAGGCNSDTGNTFLDTIGEFVCDSIADTLYRFDPSTETFTQLASLPVGRYRHAAAATEGIYLVLLGGRDLNDDLIGTVDIYNIEEDTWTTLDDLPEQYQVSDHTGFGDGAFAYSVGGYKLNYTAQTQVFRINVAESLIQTALIWEDRAPMQNARADTASVVNNVQQFAIVAGGFSHENNFCSPLGSTERYNLATDTWTSLDDMREPRSDKVLVELDNDHVYAIGGERQIDNFCSLTADTPVPGELTVAVDDVEVLHLDKGDWQSLSDLEFYRFRFAAASFKENGTFYTFGGQVAYNETCKCFDTTDEVVAYTLKEGFSPEDFETSAAFAATMGATTIAAIIVSMLAALF